MILHPSEYKFKWENNIPISITVKGKESEIKNRSNLAKLNDDDFYMTFMADNRLYGLHYKDSGNIYQLIDITSPANFLHSQNYLKIRDKNYEQAYTIFNYFVEIFLKIDKQTSTYTFSLEQENIQLAVPFNVKIMRHLLSIIRIVEERDKVLKHLDYDAIKIIMRVIFECNNVHNYLFIGRTNVEIDLYVNSWKLISIKDSVDLFDVLNEQEHTPYSHAKEEILKFEKVFSDKIKSNPVFKRFDSKSQKKLLNGNWKLSKKNSELGYWLGLNHKFIDHKYSSFCSAIHNDSHSIGINTTFTPFQDFVDYSIINDFHFLIFILSKYLKNVFRFYEDNMPVFYTSYLEYYLMKDEKVNYVMKYAKDIEINYNKTNTDIYKS